MANICKQCGAGVPDSGQFCTSCGTRLRLPIPKWLKRTIIILGVLVIVAVVGATIMDIGCGGINSREAKKVAESYWHKTFTECGHEWRDRNMFLKEITIGVQTDGMTKADQANGVEWTGHSTFRAAVARFKNNSTWLPNQNWGQTVALQKRSGKWYYGQFTMLDPFGGGGVGYGWQPIDSYNPPAQPCDD